VTMVSYVGATTNWKPKFHEIDPFDPFECEQSEDTTVLPDVLLTHEAQ
jgi:hypothetical protein